jgi:hypothetical protein
MLTITIFCLQASAQDYPAIKQGTVVAQAGSTGGSIGKRDKSISDDGEQRSSAPDAGAGRPATRNSNSEESFPKTININEHALGRSFSITLHNTGGNNYQGTWSHGYVSKFIVTALAKNSIRMERTDNPAFGAVTGSYSGSRTGNRASGQAAISNGFTSNWEATW